MRGRARCEGGRLTATLELPARALGRSRKPRRLRAIVCEPGSLAAGRPRPVVAASGRVAQARCKAAPHGKAALAELDVAAPGLAAGDYDVALVADARPWAPWAAGSAATLVAALAVIALSSWADPTAQVGYYDGKSDEEIRHDLDAEQDWDSMTISVAEHMVLGEGETTAEARIENVSFNHCDQKVRVYLTDDPTDVLWESGAISPGQYVQTIELAHPLPVGTHAATVEFQGYERTPTLVSDEGVVFGHDTFGASCAAEVTIEVRPKGVTYDGTGTDGAEL